MPLLFKKRFGEALKPQGLPQAPPVDNSEPWLPDLYQLYEQRSDDEDEGNDLPEIHKITLNSLADDRPHAQLLIFDIPVNALLDCGSNLTFINSKIFQRLKNVRLNNLSQPIELRTADG